MDKYDDDIWINNFCYKNDQSIDLSSKTPIRNINDNWPFYSVRVICPYCKSDSVTMIKKDMLQKKKDQLYKLICLSLLLLTIFYVVWKVYKVCTDSNSYIFKHVCSKCFVAIKKIDVEQLYHSGGVIGNNLMNNGIYNCVANSRSDRDNYVINEVKSIEDKC